MTEYTVAVRYVISTLQAEDIAVFETLAPDTHDDSPYVTVQFQTDRADEALGIEPGGTEVLLMVKCWAKSRTLMDVEPLATDVHNAIVTDVPVAYDGAFNVLGCWKESTLRDTEMEGDATWQMLGGVYAVQLHRI